MALGAEDFQKAKTPKGRRFLQKRAPKLHEDVKKAMFLYGNKGSQVIKTAFGELMKLKGKRDCQSLTKKNDDVRPFEAGGEVSLEFFAQKADCSLFALGSHQKKRPNNITLGRLFDHHIYDMIELGVEDVKPITEFPTPKDMPQDGNKPMFVFVGEEFESIPEFRLLKSVLLDFFRGLEVDNVNLKGLDRVIVCAAAGGRLLLRHCHVQFKKSGVRVPRVELQEMGPSLDFSVRRMKEAPPDVQKAAMQRVVKPKKKEKNVSMDQNLGKVGRIYMPKQDVDDMALQKPKGLKRERRAAAAARAEAKAGARSAAGGGGGEGDDAAGDGEDEGPAPSAAPPPKKKSKKAKK